MLAIFAITVAKIQGLCGCAPVVDVADFRVKFNGRKAVSCTIHYHHLRAGKRVPIAVGLFSLSVSGSRSRLKDDYTHTVLRKFSSVSAHKILLMASESVNVRVCVCVCVCSV